MILKKALIFLFFISLLGNISAQVITAGMEKVKMDFTVNKDGVPIYSVSYDQKTIIKPSVLGFTFFNNDNFNANFKIVGSEKKSVDETWKPSGGR